MTSFTRSAAMRLARRFRRDESGATAIEYAMIAAGVAGTIAATVWSLGAELKKNWWDKIGAIFG